MVVDLDAQWKLHQRISGTQTFLRTPEDDLGAVFDFLHNIEPETEMASSELIMLLMELCVKVNLPEKAVEFFVWGRNTGNLPPVDSLLALLSAARHLEDWKYIRKSLSMDLEQYYPNYVAHKIKVSALTGKELGFSERASLRAAASNSSDARRIPSNTPESTFSQQELAATPSATPTPGVSWIDFVSNPTGLNLAPVSEDSSPKNNMIRRDQKSLDELQKHFGLTIGDRQRKLRDEVKTWTLDQLMRVSEDNVMLTCVIEELVRRNLEEEAVAFLQTEISEKRYLISTEPFQSLATHFKEIKKVDGIMNLLEMMMKQQLAPNIALINTLLELHVSVGNLDEAVTLWNNLSHFHVTPNAHTIGIVVNLLIAAVETKSRLTLSLSQVLRMAQKHGVDLSDASYTPLLKYCITVRNYPFAHSVFAKLKSPNYQAYSLMLQVYLRTHQLQKFTEVYNILESRFGTQIDLSVLKMAQQALIQLQRPHSFIPLLRTQIMKHHFQPSLGDFSKWIKNSMNAGHVLVAMQLDQLRLEICPSLAYVNVPYTQIFLNHPIATKINPPISSMDELRAWGATSPVPKIHHPKMPAAPETDSPLSSGDAALFNALVKHWLEHNASALRQYEQEESARIRASVMDIRAQGREERQRGMEIGMLRLKSYRQSANMKKRMFSDKLL